MGACATFIGYEAEQADGTTDGQGSSRQQARRRRRRTDSQQHSRMEQRHDQFQVELTRTASKPIGMVLHHGRVGVLIRGIEENSAISEWNATHASMQVGHGDILVAVNGIHALGSMNSWRATLKELQKSNLTLVVSRISAQDSAMYCDLMKDPPTPDHLLPENLMDVLAHTPASECGVTECSVCLTAFDPEADVVQLPCQHAFHHNCAETWLMRGLTFRHANCPMCRQQIPHDFRVQTI